MFYNIKIKNYIKPIKQIKKTNKKKLLVSKLCIILKKISLTQK